MSFGSGLNHLGEDILGSGLLYLVQVQGFGLMILCSGLSHLG